MKLPVDGKWEVDHSSDRGLRILATKNINFDARGYATLANRTIDVFDEDDSANFRNPVALYQNPETVKEVGGSSVPFSINLNSLPLTITIDALSPQPTGSTNSSQAYFNNKWAVTTTNDLYTYNGSVWTNESVSLTSTIRHPACVHRGNNTLLIGNGAQVKQYNTSISETTNLTLPAGLEVVGIAYNRNFAAIITWDDNGQEAALFIWDGATAAANYSYPLGSNRAIFITAYKDTFVCLNGLGQLLKWETAGLAMLDALPSYFTSAILADIDDRLTIATDTAITVDGDRIAFNIQGQVQYRNSEPSVYNLLQPAGIWYWDPAIGLYHRHAPSGARLISKAVAPASINATTNIITTTNVPATGTPLVYCAVDDALGGLTENVIYYTIKLSSTTFSVAATRALAITGTAIDITSVPSLNNYGFAFFLESDFGQPALDARAGVLMLSGPQSANDNTSAFSLYEKLMYGFFDVPQNAIGDGIDSFGFVMDRAFNRGWIMTQKLFAASVTEKWEKLFVKARHLVTEHDYVIVKYRAKDDVNMPVIPRNPTPGTWTTLGANSSIFTTAADLSAVKTAFDADPIVGAYEVEVLQGAGAGYLAHITAITYSAPTYTVTIDEGLRNCAVNDTMYFAIDNWLKLPTKGGTAYIDAAADPNYSEFPIAGKHTKWIQFKIELRGFKVALEEMELVNTGAKPGL